MGTKGPKPGGPRTPGSGRKKGTLNKSTQTLEEKCKALGCDPFEILVRFAMGDWKGLGYGAMYRVIGMTRGDNPEPIEELTIEPGLRQKAAAEAAKYLHPQRKAIEVSNPEGQSFRVIVEDYLK